MVVHKIVNIIDKVTGETVTDWKEEWIGETITIGDSYFDIGFPAYFTREDGKTVITSRMQSITINIDSSIVIVTMNTTYELQPI